MTVQPTAADDMADTLDDILDVLRDIRFTLDQIRDHLVKKDEPCSS